MKAHAVVSLFQARLIISILHRTMHRLALQLTPIFAAYLERGGVAVISLAAALGARTLHNWSDWLSLASARLSVLEAYPFSPAGYLDGGGKNIVRFCRYPGQSRGAGDLSLRMIDFWRSRRRHAYGKANPSICKRQHETDCRIAPRTHGPKDISGLRLLFPQDVGPRALACPKTGLRATLTDAHFVLKLDIDLLGMNLRWENGLRFPYEVFSEIRLHGWINVRAHRPGRDPYHIKSFEQSVDTIAGIGHTKLLIQQLSDVLAAPTAATTPVLHLLDCLAKGFFLRLGKSLWTPVMANPCNTVQTFIDKPFRLLGDCTRRHAQGKGGFGGALAVLNMS